MLSSRDLIKNMLAGGVIDRVGIFEGFWPETPDLWVKEGYPARFVTRDGVRKIKGENPFIHFHLDLHKCGGFFDTEPIQGYEEILEKTDAWILKRNGAGATLKWWRNKSGTPEHVDFLMSSREIWERDYRPHLLDLDLNRFNGKWWAEKTLEEDKKDKDLALARKQWAFYGHVSVWETMRSSLGDFCMYENLILDPGWIRDFNRVYTDFFKRHFKYLLEKNGLPDGIWLYEDLAYKNGLFASPEILKSLVFPFYAELVDFFNDYGLPVIFHSDGNISRAIPLIIDAGFVGLNPIEAKAGCDLLRFAEEYGDRLTFIGGMDVRIFESNDRALIKKEVGRLVEGMKARNARYVFGSDHTITTKVRYDSYRYAMEAYREKMMF